MTATPAKHYCRDCEHFLPPLPPSDYATCRHYDKPAGTRLRRCPAFAPILQPDDLPANLTECRQCRDRLACPYPSIIECPTFTEPPAGPSPATPEPTLTTGLYLEACAWARELETKTGHHWTVSLNPRGGYSLTPTTPSL